ncbi:MAG: DUF1674 domain-containing protein [Cycloclasticus sp.]|nr:DUF1674 domain-containing protein [Cycloclasticus sp. 46_83_sub15_T18]OUR81858.1 DUF1674 domain-containing protein [Cycloclasticus sp. 46_120_T64]
MAKESDVVDLSKKDTAKEQSEIPAESAVEVNGRAGLEPTRYGDWEKNGRCIDF